MTTCSLPSLPTGPASPQSILLTAVKDIIKAGNLAELLVAFSSQGADCLICSDWQSASTSQRICTAGFLVRECPVVSCGVLMNSLTMLHFAQRPFDWARRSPLLQCCLPGMNHTFLLARSHTNTLSEMGKVLQVETGAQDRPESLQAGSKLQTGAVLNRGELLKDSTLRATRLEFRKEVRDS